MPATLKTKTRSLASYGRTEFKEGDTLLTARRKFYFKSSLPLLSSQRYYTSCKLLSPPSAAESSASTSTVHILLRNNRPLDRVSPTLFHPSNLASCLSRHS